MSAENTAKINEILNGDADQLAALAANPAAFLASHGVQLDAHSQQAIEAFLGHAGAPQASAVHIDV